MAENETNGILGGGFSGQSGNDGIVRHRSEDMLVEEASAPSLFAKAAEEIEVSAVDVAEAVEEVAEKIKQIAVDDAVFGVAEVAEKAGEEPEGEPTEA